MLHKNTFGKSKACEILVDELNAYGINAQRKVSKQLNELDQILKELFKINSRIAIKLAESVYREQRNYSERAPEQYKTFLLNVVSYKYKLFLVKIEAQKRTEHRKDYKI